MTPRTPKDPAADVAPVRRRGARATPGTGRPLPDAPGITPDPGGAPQTPVAVPDEKAPGGPAATGLDAWKRALSARNRRQRAGRARRKPAAGYKPGMNRTVPPGGDAA